MQSLTKKFNCCCEKCIFLYNGYYFMCWLRFEFKELCVHRLIFKFSPFRYNQSENFVRLDLECSQCIIPLWMSMSNESMLICDSFSCSVVSFLIFLLLHHPMSSHCLFLPSIPHHLNCCHKFEEEEKPRRMSFCPSVSGETHF